jgi:hypothetical protein
MEQTIEEGRGECRVRKDLSPLAEALVARDNRGAPFVALAE